MADFLSPGTNVSIIPKGPVAAPGQSTAIGGMIGSAQKGPVNSPVLTTSLDDAREVFGDSINSSFLIDQVAAFFQNGGELLYINRVAHYTNITNPATLTAISADRMFDTATGLATSGSLTSSVGSFPVALAVGATFIGSVDAVAQGVLTIQATAATSTGALATYAAGGVGDSITLNVVGVVGNQVIDLSAVAGTQAAYLAAINGALLGASAVDFGGQIRLITDRKGSSAAGTIVSFGGAAAATTGLPVGAFLNAGPNNVANVNAVTAAELGALFGTTFSGTGGKSSTGTANVFGDQMTWASVATGAASSVQLTGGTGVASIAGFDLLLHSGSAAGAGVACLLIEASSPGAWGNTEKVTITHQNVVVGKAAVTAAGATTTLTVSSASRIFVGDQISVTKLLDTQRNVVASIDGNILTFVSSITVPGGGYLGTEDVVQETFTIQTLDSDNIVDQTARGLRMSPLALSRYVENVVNNAFRTPVFVEDQSPVAPDPRPAVCSVLPLGTTTAGSDGGAVVDTDYVGDLGSKLGLYAFDRVFDVNFLAIPGQATVVVQVGIQTYVELRKDIFAILEVPQGLSPTAAVTYVQSTANLASMYEAIYYPWFRAIDVISGATVSVPPSGYIMGIYARTHRQRNFGKAPAGLSTGIVQNIVGLDIEVGKPEYDILYPANINATQKFIGQGMVVFGSRTLDPTGEFGQINVVVIFLTVQDFLNNNTRWVNFENNDSDTRGRVSALVISYLRDLRKAKILVGNTDDEAFFVTCDESNNTPNVIQQGKLVCRIGLAAARPAEFVAFTLEQDTRAIDAALAS